MRGQTVSDGEGGSEVKKEGKEKAGRIKQEAGVRECGPAEGLAIATKCEAEGLDIYAVAAKMGIAAHSIVKYARVGETGEGVRDENDRYLQHLVPYAIDTYAKLLTEPGAEMRLRISAAREVLDRRSYSGIKRVAIAAKLSISEETMGRLGGVEKLLTSGEGE